MAQPQATLGETQQVHHAYAQHS